MGYRKITNLYKDKTILMFKKVIAMEKIHGTSAHISFEHDIAYQKVYHVKYFSGGEKYENFVKLFNEEELVKKAIELGFNKSFTVYGEAYGGKQQGMSETYGKELKFVAFEVKIGDRFQEVEWANKVCDNLGLEFVHWEIVDADPDVLDKLCMAPSIQSQRNGVENPKLPREGLVLRPLKEFLYPDGVGRIMAKHKNDLYKEREHAPKIQSEEELKVLEDAKAIAKEWVNDMRLVHVLDKLNANGIESDLKNSNNIIKAMIDDVYIEAKGEIVESKQVRKQIGKRTMKLFKEKLKQGIRDES